MFHISLSRDKCLGDHCYSQHSFFGNPTDINPFLTLHNALYHDGDKCEILKFPRIINKLIFRFCLLVSVLELGLLMITSRSTVKLDPDNNDPFPPLPPALVAAAPEIPLPLFPDDIIPKNLPDSGNSHDDQATACSNIYINFLNKRDENDNDDLSLPQRCDIIMMVLDYIEDLEFEQSCELTSKLKVKQESALSHRSTQCRFFIESFCPFFGFPKHCTCDSNSTDCV